MAVFGLVKDLASRESVVNRCMGSLGWANVFYVVFPYTYHLLRNQYSPIISSLDSTHHFEV